MRPLWVKVQLDIPWAWNSTMCQLSGMCYCQLNMLRASKLTAHVPTHQSTSLSVGDAMGMKIESAARRESTSQPPTSSQKGKGKEKAVGRSASQPPARSKKGKDHSLHQVHQRARRMLLHV